MPVQTPHTATRVTFNGVNVDWKPLDVKQVTNGRGVNSATLRLFPGGRETQKLQDIDITSIDNARCEVFFTDRVAVEHRIHRGRLAANRATMSNDGLILISRLDPHVMSQESWWRTEWKASATTSTFLSIPAVLNPVYDGKVFPNRAFINNKNVLVHPDSAPGGLWTLPQAVQMILRTLNPLQVDVNNPTSAELLVQLDGSDSLIRDFRIRENGSLSQILDSLVGKFGYVWRVNFRTATPVFEFARKSDATPISFKLERFGQDADSNDSPTYDFNLTSDIASRSLNVVRVVGETRRYESTFELLPAWSATYDNLVPEELTPELVEANPVRERVYRDWVLNENGDYNGLRADAEYAAAYDFDPIFGAGTWIQRKREFLECITLSSDGTPIGSVRGVDVQYFDPVNNEWVDAEKGAGMSIQVLRRECGIRISRSQTTAEKLFSMANGDAMNIRFRVTAAVESDISVYGLSSFATPRLDTPKVHVIDASRYFFFRSVHAGSRFSGAGLLTSEVDDTVAANAHAAFVLDSMGPMSCRGSVSQNGCDLSDDFFGKSVAGIQPRNITTNVGQPGEPSRYPLITGVTYNFVKQTTTYNLDGHNK